MSIDGLKHLQEIDRGYFPFFPSVGDFEHIAMSDWNYDACFEPHPFNDWDYRYWWLTYGESYETGPGYNYRYWESYYVSPTTWPDTDFINGRYVVCIWHYANGYPSDWEAEIVCVSSTIDFGPDPWAQGRLSERQPGALAYREESIYHNRWAQGYGSASLGAIVGTYSFAADQASWQDALYGPYDPGSARFNASLVSGGAAYWWSGAIRNFQAGIDEALHQVRSSGHAIIGTVDNVINPFDWPSGVYGEDWSEFPGTWLYPGMGYWMFDGNPVVVAAGLRFGILGVSVWHSHGYMSDTVTARLEFEPNNYELVSAGTNEGNDDNIRSDPGGGGIIDLVFDHTSDTFISHSGSIDYTIRSAVKNPVHGETEFMLELPYLRDLLQATIDGGAAGEKYEDVLMKYHNFIDPEFTWTGSPPPFGGFGTSGITEQNHRLEWRYNVVPKLWLEVQWPDYYWWIPSVECPPHLRLLQRSDVAKGPFEPIPATPDCGYALRLAGRDVQQNLIPGNLPRVQPNSYP